MCNDVTAAVDRDDGEIYALCEDALPHLLDLLGYDPESAKPTLAFNSWLEFNRDRPSAEFWQWAEADPHYQELVKTDTDRDSPPELPESLRPVFHLLSSYIPRAATVLFERNYFDLDYRSELSVLQTSTFLSLLSNADRMHFFTTPPNGKDVRLRDFVSSTLPNPLDPLETRSQPPMPDDAARATYLGYVVLKPQLNRGIGRAMVPPRSAILDASGVIVLDAEVVDQQVRTAVPEQVNLFGIYLLVVGVPFMEQDGALLRCAHVSAWMCHYSAVLRGAVARRPTAHFHRAGGWTHAIGRQYPSGGVSTIELTTILRDSDMPAELLSAGFFARPRLPHFADRIGWTERIKSMEWAWTEPDKESAVQNAARRAEQSRSSRMWAADNLSAAVCRYLNSGIPVILNRRGHNHTQVAIGYLRASDIAGTRLETDAIDESDADAPSTVRHLIVADDQKAPFHPVPLSELVTEILAGQTEVLVPLPNSLWMSGDVAEKAGIKLITQLAQLRATRVRESAGESDGQIPDNGVGEFCRQLQANEDVFTTRTYASTGVDFKRHMSRTFENLDAELVSRVSTMQLPKYVWVVEVIDRKTREEHGETPVVAMVVLDASQVVTEDLDTPEALQDLPPLFLHIPGHMFVRKFGLGSSRISRKTRVTSPKAVDQGWVLATALAYETGRWSHHRLRELSAQRNSNQSKSATVGP